MTKEGFLQLVMNRRAGGESFHRRDFMSLDLTGRDQAGADRFTIEQDGACATISGIAADLGSSQPEAFTKYFGQAFQRRDRSGYASFR